MCCCAGCRPNCGLKPLNTIIQERELVVSRVCHVGSMSVVSKHYALEHNYTNH